jgi:hypothetical protein
MRLQGNKAVDANAIEPFARRWRTKNGERVGKKEALDLHSLLDDSEGLAFTLDNVLNNTSVVALLSYRGKNLL